MRCRRQPGQAGTPPKQDDLASAAHQELAAAVRSAALQTMMLPTKRVKPGPETAPTAASGLYLGEMTLRLSVAAKRLPVLPDTATLARSAFAEAVIALRSGLTRSGIEFSGENRA